MLFIFYRNSLFKFIPKQHSNLSIGRKRQYSEFNSTDNKDIKEKQIKIESEEINPPCKKRKLND